MAQSKTMAPSAAAVDAVDVAKNFGAVTALGGVNLTIPAGTLTALLGPNGAGKTTLVRIIATLTRQDRGRVSVFGFDVADAPGQVRARIGLTGQYVGLDDALTGRDNLVLIGRLAGLAHRRARSRAAELAELLGVADALDRPVRTYSGGMRRRLDLAASLMTNPPLIVLDEPTTGLVARKVAEIRLDRPDDADAAVSVLAAKAAIAARAEPGSGRLTMPTHDGADTLLSAAAALRASGIAIADLGLRQPSLDEAFLALTGPAAPATAASDATAAGARP